MLDKSVALFRKEGYLNIQSLIVQIKQVFNIDDNRVFLAGFSDGASSTYNIACGLPTAFAAFFPINGWLSGNSPCVNFANRPILGFPAERDMYNHQTMLDKAGFTNRFGGNWQILKIPKEGHFYYPYAGQILPQIFEDNMNFRIVIEPKSS